MNTICCAVFKTRSIGGECGKQSSPNLERNLKRSRPHFGKPIRTQERCEPTVEEYILNDRRSAVTCRAEFYWSQHLRVCFSFLGLDRSASTRSTTTGWLIRELPDISSRASSTRQSMPSAARCCPGSLQVFLSEVPTLCGSGSGKHLQ